MIRLDRTTTLLLALAVVAGLALTVPPSAQAQTVIYVDDDATGADDGSKSDPYAALQEALAEAETTSGAVEIRVAEGTYYPDEGGGVTDGDTTATFSLSDDLTAKGGYTSDFSGRDPNANVTALSGDVDQDDATNGNGVVTDTADISGSNSVHVVRASQLSAPATLVGLAITAGQADDPDAGFGETTDQGGGILASDSDLTLQNVEVVGNYAVTSGGGIRSQSSGTVTIEASTLRANAGARGGAIHATSELVMTNVSARDNVGNEGGAVHVSGTSITLTEVTFSGNKAIETGERNETGNGGALFVDTGLSKGRFVEMRSVTFENNTTEYTGFGDPSNSRGGGAYLDVYAPTLVDVTFRGNTVSETDAGGLYLSISCGEIYCGGTSSGGIFRGGTSSGGIFRGGLFENNAASSPPNDATDANGGAMVIRGGQGATTVANTTFRNNTASGDGGAVVASDSVTFEGVLFEGNSTDSNGGGLEMSGDGWNLRDVVFRGNTTGGAGTLSGGGGLSASTFSTSGVTGRLTNVRFVNNESGDSGGGMRLNGGRYEAKNVDFIDNVTVGNFGGKGAALLNDGATVQLVNAEVRANNGPGGIIEAVGDAQNTGTNRLVNVLLADNGTETAGSGVVLNGTDGTTTLNNVAVANNGGTGLVNSNTMTVHNSIVYDNDGPSDIDEINNDAESTIDVQNTLVRGGLSGQYVRNDGTINDNGGNISGDPMFTGPSNGDYHLQSGSPAIDAGDDPLIPDDSLDLDVDGDTSEALPYDLDQRSRTENTVDLGPYERGSALPTFTKTLSSGASSAGLPKSFRAELSFQTLSTSTDLTVTHDASASTDGLGLPGEQGLAVTSLWNIEFDPEPSSSEISATVCFDIRDLSFPVVDRSALNIYARSGPVATDWQERTPTELRPSADDPEQICATGQSSFSQFAVTAQKSELPVELVAFDAQTDGGRVLLSWQTGSETNNAGFDVQHRASETGSWRTLGFVEGAGTTTQAQRYRFSPDESLAPGTHQFRLRQVDADGTAHLSETVTAEIGLDEPVRLTAPAPNPVQARATLSFAVREPAEATLVLYNTLGQTVRTLYRGTPAAGEAQTVEVSTTGLASGLYFLRLQADGRTETRRLTVVR
jgi:predicted outer membrane repeat protein